MFAAALECEVAKWCQKKVNTSSDNTNQIFRWNTIIFGCWSCAFYSSLHNRHSCICRADSCRIGQCRWRCCPLRRCVAGSYFFSSSVVNIYFPRKMTSKLIVILSAVILFDECLWHMLVRAGACTPNHFAPPKFGESKSIKLGCIGCTFVCATISISFIITSLEDDVAATDIPNIQHSNLSNNKRAQSKLLPITWQQRANVRAPYVIKISR